MNPVERGALPCNLVWHFLVEKCKFAVDILLIVVDNCSKSTMSNRKVSE